jgi:hypothetical protein
LRREFDLLERISAVKNLRAQRPLYAELRAAQHQLATAFPHRFGWKLTLCR